MQNWHEPPEDVTKAEEPFQLGSILLILECFDSIRHMRQRFQARWANNVTQVVYGFRDEVVLLWLWGDTSVA